MDRRVLLLGAAWLLGGSTTAAAATAPDDGFSASVALGIAYNSQVAVVELDQSAGAGDLAKRLELGLSWQRRHPGGTRLSASYELWESRQVELPEFDLRSHALSLDMGMRLGQTEVGLLLNRADAALDGERYLGFSQASPYVSRMLGEGLALRLAYAWTDRDFPSDPARDARLQTLSADAFVLLDGMQRYLVLGLRLEEDSAREREFDLEGYRLSLHSIHHLSMGARELKLRAGLRHEGRRYAKPLLPLGSRRRDERYRLETRFELPLLGPFRASARYEYGDNRSTLPAADFSEHLVALSLQASF
jgi:hypothetical protein